MPNTNDTDKNKGIYQKFRVERTDGSSAPGGKHEHCRYFVLDLDHDPHAVEALRAYAQSCKYEYPALSKDLITIAGEPSDSPNTSVSHADLECPICGKMCKPSKETKDGGALYRCRNTNAHADFRALNFRIDGNGDLFF